MNDEQFKQTLAAVAAAYSTSAAILIEVRDTAQREALARVEAERDLAVSQRDHNLYSARLMTEAAEEAQAQLEEAVAFIAGIAQEPENGSNYGKDRIKFSAKAFLARYVQSEQKEAGHGHVTPRLDGVRARCGGPGMCAVCKAEQQEAPKREVTFRDLLNIPTSQLPREEEAQGVQSGYELKRLSVTNILLDVVPGPDGMGHEVYASSVEEVVRRLSDLGDKVEDLTDELARARAAFATQPAEWVEPVVLSSAGPVYDQGFADGVAAAKRLNAVRGAEHD